MRFQTLLVLAFLAVTAACDEGDSPLEVHLADLGIPRESLITVNEATLVTVYVANGVTELLHFEPHRFGGWELSRDQANCPAPGGGVQDASFSAGEEIDGEQEPAYSYFFGTNPSLASIRTNGAEAGWKIVDPSVGSWVIFIPNDRAERLRWSLLDARGEQLNSGVGTTVAWEFCPER